MARVYEHFLNSTGIPAGSYNAGFENISVMSIANMVANKFSVAIEVKESNDPRSYRQDSTKLLETGFVQTKFVSDAIEEISNALSSGDLKDDDRWHTVRWMTANQIGDLK
jgi:nucleoside-diphosphate-sugar epimerase